jgi:glycerophosphoryl diester phosphodiesterase
MVCVLAIVLLGVICVIYPPGSVFYGALKPKLLIIANRGESMLAPGNSVASANFAAYLDGYGLEPDI